MSIAEGVGIRLFASAESKLGVSGVSVIIVVVRSEREEGTANVPFWGALSRRSALCLGTSMLKSQLCSPNEAAQLGLPKSAVTGAGRASKAAHNEITRTATMVKVGSPSPGGEPKMK